LGKKAGKARIGRMSLFRGKIQWENKPHKFKILFARNRSNIRYLEEKSLIGCAAIQNGHKDRGFRHFFEIATIIGQRECRKRAKFLFH
jgi:hypothetical protein